MQQIIRNVLLGLIYKRALLPVFQKTL
jgi:hypothetical protein